MRASFVGSFAAAAAISGNAAVQSFPFRLMSVTRPPRIRQPMR
jgi:hypothetical protein